VLAGIWFTLLFNGAYAEFGEMSVFVAVGVYAMIDEFRQQ
jgi:hypothetical protein